MPGSTSQIEEIKKAYEAGRDLLADGLPEGIDSEAVAGTLKLYLRQLEDPVMTRKMYSSFAMIGGIDDHNNRLMAMREAVAEHLPKEHGAILEAVMPFLHLVSQYADENKMNVSNLALVFGPTLMPAPKDDFGAMLRDANSINTLMASFINYHGYVLPNAKPVATPPDHGSTAEAPEAAKVEAPAAARAETPEAEEAPEAAPAAAPAVEVAVVEPPPSVPKPASVAPAAPAPRKETQDASKGAAAAASAAVTVEPEPEQKQVNVALPDSAPAVAENKEEEEGEEEFKYARAQFDYKARNDTEIPFRKGDIITVYDQADKNWWTGELNGKQGFIAAAYVKLVDAPATAAKKSSPPQTAPPKPAPSPRTERKITRRDKPDAALDGGQVPVPAAAKAAPAAAGVTRLAAEEQVERGPSPSPMGAPPLPPVDHEPPSQTPPASVDSLPPPEPEPAITLRATRGRSMDLSPKMTRAQSFGPTFAPPPPPPGDGSPSMPPAPENEELELPPVDMDASLFLPPPPSGGWSDNLHGEEDMPPPPMSDEEC